MINLRKHDPIADAVKDILQQEALKGNQTKIDKNHNNKIDGQDFKILRGEKKAVKEEETVDEGLKDMVKKAFKTLTGGSDEDQRKDLQRKMGVPQTGKKPEPQKEEVEQVDEIVKIFHHTADGASLSRSAKNPNDAGAVAHRKAAADAAKTARAGGNFKFKGNSSMTPLTPKSSGGNVQAVKSEEVEQVDEGQDANDSLDPNRMDNRNRPVKRNIQARLGHDERGDARVRAGQPRSTHMRNKPQLPEEVQGKTLRQFKENAFDWKKKPEPQPNGGSGVKQGSAYGGSKQKDKPEQDTEKK